MKRFYSTGYLLVANLATIVIGAACIPVLAALYTPEQFGVCALAVSVACFLSIGASLQLEQFIPGCRHAYEARFLVALIARMIALVTAAFLLLAPLALRLAGREDWLWSVIPIALIAATMALNQLLQLALIRRRRYGMVANRQLFLVSVKSALQFFLGLRPAGYFINAMVIGEVVTRALQLLLADKTIYRWFRSARRLPLLLGYARRRGWLAKGAQAGMARLLNDGINLILPVLITFLYGINATGQFSIAYTTVISFNSALITTINSLFMGEAAAFYHSDRARFRRYLYRCLLLMTLAGGAMYGLSQWLAGPLIDWLFHDRWGKVYVYFMILLPAHCVSLATGMFITALNVMHRPKALLYTHIAWNALLWPFSLWCYASGASAEQFLFGLTLSIILKQLCAGIFTVYWARGR